MKKFLLMLLILFVCGLISADLAIRALQEQDILMNHEKFLAYAYSNFLFKEAFWGILYERVKMFGMIILILFTPFREKCNVFFAAVVCFIWGFFMMCSIDAIGMVGLLVGICSVIPHGCFYIAVLFLLAERRRGRRYLRTEQIGKNLLSYFFILLLFVTGCIIETVIGTQFIPWMIRLSNV